MREAEFAALLRAGQDEFAARRRVLRAAGVIMAGCALCAALVLLSWSAGGEGGSELLSSSSLPKLAPLQELHWVNHEFRKVHTMQAHPTRLELADQNAERQARTAAKWGTLAATKDVFRSKQFTAQLESMKENAQLTESKAQKLDSEINYEGKLLKVGRQGTSSIIAQAAMAAHDAIGSVSGAVSAANPAHDGPSDGRTFRSHEFVEVYPKPYHYAHGMPGGTRFQKEEKKFLAGVDHEVRMHKLAADLKLTQKKGTDSDADDKSDGILESRTDMTDGVDPSSTAAAAKRLAMSRASDAVHGTNLVDDKSDGILESRTDMTDGVDPSATAAAAKRLAVSRAGSVKQAQGTNLATPADSSDDKGLLDNHRDMGNGVDTKATQEAARKLATSLVRKMQESAEATVLKGGAAGQKAAANDSEMKRAEDDDAKKVQKLQDWAKANPSDNAKVRELKKELWQAEEQQEEAHSKGGDASQTGARVAASAARKIETSNGKTRSEMFGKAMQSAVTNAVKSIVDHMSAGPAAKKFAMQVSRAAPDTSGLAQQIEAKARGVEEASSRLEAQREPVDAAGGGKASVAAQQLRQKIREELRDEESHKNAAQLLQAQAVAVRQNAVLRAAHEAELDYPGATLAGQAHQEVYL